MKLNFTKKLTILILITVFSLLNLSALNVSEETWFKIIVSDFENNNGQALLHVYKKGDDVPKKSSYVFKTKINGNSAVFLIKNLNYNEYAAIAIHDANGNGKIDHNSMGMPNEPMGYTNDWEFGIFTGMPDFDDLKFKFSKNGDVFKIKMDN